MSSSNRPHVDFDANLSQDGKPTGPIRLPAKNAIEFVNEFNRLYGRRRYRITSDVGSISEKAGDYDDRRRR
ncbi:hypothetical protein [Roseiconus lacunae]|uniref:hypothetical protein n=1 Tax=Roseiconus lacunae TaxID=2605694 RepID=UPI001E31B851|nr:hypothetical protein [Roseiconus lacunae]MCD0461242.1 hypothetical protein [Roseiconus lacunae]